MERSKLAKLKWLLHCTMGCQDTTFATRKRELAMLRGQASDADVLRSYLSSVDSNSSDPWMLDFLRLGRLDQPFMIRFDAGEVLSRCFTVLDKC